MMAKKLILITIALVTFLINPLSMASSYSESRMMVAVSVPTLEPFIVSASGGAVEVINIVPVGVEPHEYQLRPSDLERASSADLLVITGHFEWEEKLPSLVNVKNVLNLMEELGNELRILRLPSGDLNLHEWWLSAENAKLIIRKAAEVLSEADRENSEKFKLLSETSIKNIEETIGYVRTELKKSGKVGDIAICSTPFEQYVLDSFGIGCLLVLSEEELAGIKPEVLESANKMIASGAVKLIVSSDVSEGMIGAMAAKELSDETGVPFVRPLFLHLYEMPFEQILAINAGMLLSTPGVEYAKAPRNAYDPLLLSIIAILALIVAFESFLIFRMKKRI